MEFQEYIIVFLVTVFAGMYGLIFGGGSFLTLPVLFLLGVDPKTAVATNQLGSTGQMLTGSWIFIKNKRVDFQTIKWMLPAFILGALIGANILIAVDSDLIKKLVSGAIIFFAIFTLFKNPEELKIENVGRNKKIFGIIVILLIGIYSVVITASSGTMLTFTMMYLFHLKLKRAIENRQSIVLGGALVASAFLATKGLIDPILVIPLFFGRMLGGYLGAHLVLKTQSKYLRIIFSIVIILLAVKTLLL